MGMVNYPLGSTESGPIVDVTVVDFETIFAALRPVGEAAFVGFDKGLPSQHGSASRKRPMCSQRADLAFAGAVIPAILY